MSTTWIAPLNIGQKRATKYGELTDGISSNHKHGKDAQTHICARVRARTHAHTQAHTHSHTHAHTQARTHETTQGTPIVACGQQRSLMVQTNLVDVVRIKNKFPFEFRQNHGFLPKIELVYSLSGSRKYFVRIPGKNEQKMRKKNENFVSEASALSMVRLGITRG